jgi:hypothetical protein
VKHIALTITLAGITEKEFRVLDVIESERPQLAAHP